MPNARTPTAAGCRYSTGGASAANEISHWDGYDYVLINDHVEGCFDEVRAILRAERLKRRRQIGLIGFARDLIRSVPDADKKL